MTNPTTAVTWSSEFLKIFPVVAGGLLAVFGGMLSQYLTYRLNANRDKAKIKREKLEALVQNLYEHADWLDDKRNKLVYSTESHDDPSPLEKAWMLQKLYFPQLEDALQALAKAALPLATHCMQQRQAQLQDRNAWIASYQPDVYMDLYRTYRSFFLTTVQQAGKLASRYSDV
jgi:ABC-type nitrate/sulfonate/bicarbonate transport system substrate-binding protein